MFDMFLISQNTAAVICDDQPSVFDRNYVSGGKKKCCVFVSTQTKNKKNARNTPWAIYPRF